MVDSDRVYIQVVRPRIVWVKPLPYEVNIDETKEIIEALINEPINPKETIFGTYDKAKARIEVEIKLPQELNKSKMRISKLKIKNAPLMITEGKGEDEEDSKKEDESEKEGEPIRK